MFKEVKTAQVAAFFLAKAPGHRMPHLKLMKLLYLADRESMRETGYPMSWDRLVSMPHGPVLSTTLNLINSVSGLKCKAYKCILWRTSRWNYWVNEHASIVCELRNKESLFVVTYIKRNNRTLCFSYLEALFAETFQRIASYVPQAFYTLWLCLKNT